MRSMRNFDSLPPEVPAAPEHVPDVGEKLRNDETVEVVLDDPELRSYTTLAYEFPEHDGRALSPGHRFAFVIPESFRTRLVRDVILRHRKDARHAVDIGPDRHDPYGAYSRVELHDPETGDWRGWRDPKGYSPDKFAEPRPANDPENEVLHDWLATVGEVRSDAIRVTNVGQHPEHSVSQVHGVEIVFFPELDGVTYHERIYCPGTQFIDLEQRRLLPSYGGGSHTEGKYIGAIPLNQSGAARYELGNDPGPNVTLESARLIIALDSEKSLAQVEVAIGDTEHLDTVHPKTGRRTRLGYAKLWVGIRRAGTREVDWFIQNANIPPQGVIAGGPHLEQANVQPGDELVIEARADAAYVMGWRIAYTPSADASPELREAA